jgi:hypothetical protein
MSEIDAKKELLEILDYYKYRVTHGCTMDEIDSAIRALENNMEINGTLDNFADFYGKSKTAVSSQIKRNLIAKPKKNVTLYPFHKFRKIIPSSWRKND